MSTNMRVFVNNVDGFLASAVCADLWKLNASFVGTRKGRSDEGMPPMVRKIVPRVDVRRLIKAAAACDVIVYDLHDADLEELELVLRTLHASELQHELTFVLISSVGVWARTQREFDEVPVEKLTPEPTPAEETGLPPGSAKAKAKAEPTPPPTASPDAAEPTEEAAAAEEVEEPKVTYRQKPLRSEDYVRRVPAPKFGEWRSIETLVLGLHSKPNITPYVVCCGIPYGNGEDALLGLFKAAWRTLPTLRVIGDGGNVLPLVHVRDAARLVRAIVEQRPPLQYHLAVDRGDATQRALVEAVAAEFGLTDPIPSISIAEALLAEMADVFTLDLRLEPSLLMAPPERQGPTMVTDPADSSPPPTPFRWWSEQGLVANVAKVSREFCRWRRLEQLRICVSGPPGCGDIELARQLGQLYNVPALEFDQLVEEVRKQQSSLGQEVARAMEEIDKGAANPKGGGPCYLPPALAAQCVEEGLKAKPVAFRGYVLAGFPQNSDDVPVFFCEDGPLPAQPEPAAVEGQEGEAPAEEAAAAPAVEKAPPPRLIRRTAVQDAMVLLSSSEESCFARMKAAKSKLPEALAKRKMERWTKEHPSEAVAGEGYLSCLDEKLGVQAVSMNADETELEDMALQVFRHVKGRRNLYNFMQNGEPAKEEPPAAEAPGPEDATQEAQARRTIRPSKEQAQAMAAAREEELRQLQKDETARLEKHSEPFRQYLSSLVLPTLTSGLIDLCREQPEDPVGYLAEYLSVYSQVAKRYGKKPGFLKAP